MRVRPDQESPALEELRSYGRSLIDAVPTDLAQAAARRAMTPTSSRQRSRRLVVGLAVTGLLATSSVGMATVSDIAAPGDLLYPVDRGYEWVSDLFGTKDRTPERLAESAVLDERGDTEEAIEFLRDELAVESSKKEALANAIEDLEDNIARTNQGQTGEGTPAMTAPGQVKQNETIEDPSSPSDTAPGQNKDKGDKENPSESAPGQNKDAMTTTTGSSNGNGNGNNGNGRP